jgi:hypothetical protein
MFIRCGTHGGKAMYRRLKEEETAKFLYYWDGDGDASAAGWYAAGDPKNKVNGEYLDFWNTSDDLPVTTKGDCQGHMKELGLDSKAFAALLGLPEAIVQTIRSEFTSVVGHAVLAEAEKAHTAASAATAEAGKDDKAEDKPAPGEEKEGDKKEESQGEKREAEDAETSEAKRRKEESEGATADQPAKAMETDTPEATQVQDAQTPMPTLESQPQAEEPAKPADSAASEGKSAGTRLDLAELTEIEGEQPPKAEGAEKGTGEDKPKEESAAPDPTAEAKGDDKEMEGKETAVEPAETAGKTATAGEAAKDPERVAGDKAEEDAANQAVESEPPSIATEDQEANPPLRLTEAAVAAAAAKAQAALFAGVGEEAPTEEPQARSDFPRSEPANSVGPQRTDYPRSEVPRSVFPRSEFPRSEFPGGRSELGRSEAGGSGYGARSEFIIGRSVIRNMSISPISSPGINVKRRRRRKHRATEAGASECSRSPGKKRKKDKKRKRDKGEEKENRKINLQARKRGHSPSHWKGAPSQTPPPQRVATEAGESPSHLPTESNAPTRIEGDDSAAPSRLPSASHWKTGAPGASETPGPRGVERDDYMQPDEESAAPDPGTRTKPKKAARKKQPAAAESADPGRWDPSPCSQESGDDDLPAAREKAKAKKRARAEGEGAKEKKRKEGKRKRSRSRKRARA